MQIAFISLGCDKNRVDSEKILYTLFEKYENVEVVEKLEEAELCIINTCSFIHDAKIESLEQIAEACKCKNDPTTKLKKIVVCGCLVSENKQFLLEHFPEIDEALSIKEYKNKLNALSKRILDYSSYSANLKISDGCSNNCAYCIIPRLRGAYHSYKMEDLYAEAEFIATEYGVVELNIVAQDITNYGIDIYKQKKLVDLLKKLSSIEQFTWIRLLYCYPEGIDDTLIEEIKTNKKIVKYLDIPIQHISNDVLKRMNRKTTKEDIYNVIKKLRENIPDIQLRTSLIVGFPGETEEDFKQLCNFVKQIKFDKLGVFTYSDEELALSYKMDNKIDEDTKNKRKQKIMKLQKKIIEEKNESSIGKVYKCIIDGFIPKENIYIGRTEYDTKDIDRVVYIDAKKKKLHSGDFVDVKINEYIEYDLVGEVV